MNNNKEKKNTMANILEKMAHKSVEIAIDSRCMYIYHQPKMPEGLNRIKK